MSPNYGLGPDWGEGGIISNQDVLENILVPAALFLCMLARCLAISL